MDQNSTPIPSSLLEVPEFNSSATPPANKKRKLRLDDLYLIGSACVFVLSIGFMMTSQNFTANSEAKLRRTIEIVPKKTSINKAFPKSYKEEKIPDTVYSSAENAPGIPSDNKEEFIKNEVMKFYAYKDALTENAVTPQKELVPVSFQDVLDGTKALETLINESLISKAFFGYIQVKFTGMADEETLSKRYGDLNQKALSIIKKYQQMFVLGEYTPQQIIDISNHDEEILIMNDREQNKFIDDYDATKNPFGDTGFDDFLYSQAANQLSDKYMLKKDGKPYGYVIVYPSKISKNKYNSLDQILKEKANNFRY